MQASPPSRFQILRDLSGTRARRIHLAHDAWIDERCVLKQVLDSGAEGHALMALVHPHVVGLRDVVRHDNALFLVLEYVAGEDFLTWASQQPPQAIVRASAGLWRALTHLHARGWVHRDIAPNNVRVSSGEIHGLPAVGLLDFDLACIEAPPEAAGTAGFMAPEVLAGEPASVASDLYAFGALLFAALTGRAPSLRVEDTHEALDESAAEPTFCEIIGDLLQRDPKARPGHSSLAESFTCLIDDLALTLDVREPATTRLALLLGETLEPAVDRVLEGGTELASMPLSGARSQPQHAWRCSLGKHSNQPLTGCSKGAQSWRACLCRGPAKSCDNSSRCEASKWSCSRIGAGSSSTHGGPPSRARQSNVPRAG
ncbi:MAG: protein kinase [Deltaproteobacteria bacterium]|nr:protein kinase [Deltaproteobacteria bacterium]